ncbi:MAG: nucleotidyltransferase domain-containing protein [Actinomycetota bacterium]
MDYVAPVRALIPGARGRILEVLGRTQEEMTLRQLGRLSGVSVNRVTALVGELVALGIVARRDVPPVSLVRLSADNAVAEMVRELGGLHRLVLARLKELAKGISPAPASLVVFGSFARGLASTDSDIDVLVVRGRGVRLDHDQWTESLGAWSDRAGRISGNRIALVEVGTDELPGLRRRPLWKSVVQEGILLAGKPLEEAARASA